MIEILNTEVNLLPVIDILNTKYFKSLK